MLEHQCHNTDLLDIKPELINEPDIALNLIEVNDKQNLTADPTIPDPIKIKDEPKHDEPMHDEPKHDEPMQDEPMQDEPGSNVKTLQAAGGKNLYLITTSDGKLILRSDLEDEIRSIKLDKQVLSNGSNKDVKDNAKQSKICDFLKSFEEEIKDDNDGNDMEVEDSTYMLNEDPLKDDESLNSMDDIDSDNRDSDNSDSNIKSKNIVKKKVKPDINLDSDSDTDSIIEFFENAIQTKNLKVKVSKINDIKVAESLLKFDTKNKLLKKRIKFLKSKADIENNFLKSFNDDGYDLGDGVKISKEVFLKMYERCENNASSFRYLGE